MHFDPAGHGTALRTEEVAKAYFSAAPRAARKAARAGRRAERLRGYAKPVMDEADEVMRRRLVQAEAAGDRLSRQAAVRIGLGTGAGIGGGMTLGYGAKRVIDPDRRRQQHRNRSQYALAKADDYDDYRNRVLADINGIPPWRRNPISPLQLVAASNIVGEGLADIRSRNPFFRRRRTVRGVQQMAAGQQMAYRGIGES